MIVKQRRGLKWSPSTLYGFAGAAFVAVTAGLMLNSQFAGETYPSCTERYAQAGMLSLEGASGDVLSPAELQSRLGGNEWGVLHNIAIKPEVTPAGKGTMTVNFEPGGKADRAARDAVSGAGFSWEPGYLRKAEAACLSYSVRFSETFVFSPGGTLPGLFGEPLAADAVSPFSMRMRWLEGARVGIQLVTPKNRLGHVFKLSDKWLRLPVGKWVDIEQEVVLNTPGKNDGIVRIWVDGRLHLHQKGLTLRKDDSNFAGVVADTHYADRKMDWAPAPKAATIKMSPLIVRWN